MMSRSRCVSTSASLESRAGKMTAFDMLTATRNFQAAGRGPKHPLKVIVNAMRSAVSERVSRKAYRRELERRVLELEERLMNCQGVLLLAGLGLLFAALKLTS